MKFVYIFVKCFDITAEKRESFDKYQASLEAECKAWGSISYTTITSEMC